MGAEAAMCDHPLGILTKLITPVRLGRKEDKPSFALGFSSLASAKASGSSFSNRQYF